MKFSRETYRPRWCW